MSLIHPSSFTSLAVTLRGGRDDQQRREHRLGQHIVFNRDTGVDEVIVIPTFSPTFVPTWDEDAERRVPLAPASSESVPQRPRERSPPKKENRK